MAGGRMQKAVFLDRDGTLNYIPRRKSKIGGNAKKKSQLLFHDPSFLKSF